MKSESSYTTGCWSLFALFLMVFSCSTYAATGLDKRIELAAEHIIRMQLDSGLFRYEHDFVSGADSQQNNIVRQAGAAFALGEYLLYSKDPVAREAI
ncbi:MAG: hypothetical protein KDI18_16775, partial [Gammaproteobacteria bacterium]|nr:hypothetical protein [Gammaproteobacteria bacterium]